MYMNFYTIILWLWKMDKANFSIPSDNTGEENLMDVIGTGEEA
jgi:hypothetical protein